MIHFKENKLSETNGKVDFDLRSFIPEGHLCRLLEQILSNLDLSPIIRSYSPLGQRGMSPKMLLSVIFYGYTEGIRSGQSLSDRCKRDLHYIYLSGGLQPSKTTINAFRRNHYTFFKDLFKQQLSYLGDLNCINTSEGHGDGTMIRANASSKRVKTQIQYEKWLKILKLDVEEIEEALAKNLPKSKDKNEVI